MKFSLTILIAIVSTLILMSVDIYREWLDPIESQGVMVEWFSSFGLRNGALVLANSDFGLKDGWSSAWHKPDFYMLPLYIGAGPEGGGIFVAVWFLVPLVALVIFLFRKLITSPAQPARRDNHL